MKMRITAAVVLAAILSGGVSPAAIESKDVAAMRVTFAKTVLEFNKAGRLDTTGAIGGMVNNVWQTVSRSDDAANLGCVGQSSALADKLRSEFPGWNFEQRFEFGLKSPILLAHEWITATDGHGNRIDLDPWMNEFINRKAAR